MPHESPAVEGVYFGGMPANGNKTVHCPADYPYTHCITLHCLKIYGKFNASAAAVPFLQKWEKMSFFAQGTKQ
jgi:hypothetical protein